MTTKQDDFVVEVQALITGFQKRAPNITILYASQSYTTMQIVQMLQALVSSGGNVSAARAAYHTAVLANDETVQQNKPFVSTLRTSVQGMFKGNETALADFGLSLPKPRKVLTGQQLAVAAAKRKATREARGTTSKKQKATLSGNVTGLQFVPITSGGTTGSTPAPTPSPAPSATAATGAPPAAPASATATVSNGATPPASPPAAHS